MRLLFTVFLTSVIAIIASADVSSLTTAQQHKINLEDIEQDTLLNEIRSKSQETLHAEPTEHVPPTAASHVQHTGPTGAPPTASGGAVSHQTIVYHQSGGQHQQTYSHGEAQPTAGPSAYQSGITYAQSIPQQQQYSSTGPSAPAPFHYSHSAPAAPHPAQYVHQQPNYVQHQVHSNQPIVYYSHHAHYPQEPVQYVQFQPQHHQNISPFASNLIAPPVPQVHEDGRTYSAPSRHTLEVATQQQKHFKTQPPRTPVGFRPRPALINPQPQYVYVQGNSAASVQQQKQFEQKFQQQQQQQQQTGPGAPQKVHNVEIIQSQGQQIAPVEYVPQQSSGGGVSYSQSTPYFQYSGSFGHPQTVNAGHPSVPVNNYVVVPYTTSPNVYQHQQQQQQQPGTVAAVAPVTQTTLSSQPIVPEVPHYVHPTKTVIPSGPPQVFIQPPHHTNPYISHAPHHYHPQQLPSYPTLSYAPSHPGSGVSFAPGHGYNYYQPTLDFFGPYARHTSLLNSYVPSNLIYSKSRQHYNQFYAHPQVGIAPQQHHPHIEQDHSPIYNTIAYSTEQKPVVVPPPSPHASASPLTKRESTVLRAAKPTALTKLENVKFVKKSN